jgi:2-deoxy-D-gluconate 3-dehydrogenase
MAVALAEAGADVAVTARSAEGLKDTGDAIRKAGRKAVEIVADVSVEEDLDRILSEAIGAFGKIDILVNNVGTTARHPAEEFPLEDWDRVMDVNVRSVFSLTNRVVKSMKATGGGRIINTASLLSELGVALIPAYAASKGAIRQLTKAWAVEWAKYNIRVNAIGPGYMRTEMTETLYHDKERYAKVMSRVAIKRWGTPEDVKGAVVFLASRASGYITGQVIYVDGGWLAG